MRPSALLAIAALLASGPARTDSGSAALLTLKGKQAKVEWLVAPKPE